MEPKDIITGKIKQGDLEVSFVGEDHRFVFLPSKYISDPIIFNHEIGVLKPDNDFLKGRTFSGQWIWIYCRTPLSLTPTSILNTWLYIISTGDMNDFPEMFDSIRFEGGSLNSTFYQKSLKYDFGHEDDNKVSLTLENDTITIPLNDDNVTDLKVYSTVIESSSITNGISVYNTGAKLRLTFQESTRIDDHKQGFIKHYGDINTLISFMTFRQNIYFDHVYLGLGIKDEYKENEIFITKFAECFLKKPEIIDEPRKTIRCITFDELTHDSIAKLYKTINTRDSKKPSYHVSFLPQSAKEASYVTITQLREVCTSMELEASLAHIHASNERALRNLTEKIQEVINASKLQDELTEREYSYIQGNISHWNAPAAELAKQLFNENKESLIYLLKFVNKDNLTEEDIQAVIKVRNSATHTGAFSFSENEVKSLFVMMGVVYSAILKRCDVSSTIINEIFEHGLMTVR